MVGATSEKPELLRETPIVWQPMAANASSVIAMTLRIFIILLPYRSQNLQFEFSTHLADERSGDISQRPFAIALQLRFRRHVETEELESLQDDGVASTGHGAVVDFQGDSQRAIIIDLQAIGQCRRE